MNAFRVNGLHHAAYKCKDPVETRRFYEQVLGMPLEHVIRATHIPSTGGEPVHYFHMFFRMADGSYLAFFDLGDDEAPLPSTNTPAWVTHIALELKDEGALALAKARLAEAGIDVVGPWDHGFIKSIYFFDPNGIRMEFTARVHSENAAAGSETESRDQQYRCWLSERSRAKEFARSWPLAKRN